MARTEKNGSETAGAKATGHTIFVVDDDADVRDSLTTLLQSADFECEAFASAHDFLDSGAATRPGCLVADIRMPDMDGLELQAELARRKSRLPVIIITGHADVPLAVRAMKGGAVDFIEKPFDEGLLLSSVRRALATGTAIQHEAQATQSAAAKLAQLTEREREVLTLVVSGRANKEIARELNISPRTVEIHRAHVMEKMEAGSLAELVRITLRVGDSPTSFRLH